MPVRRSRYRRGLLEGAARRRARTMRHEPTDAERALWWRLRGRGLGGMKFRRQFALNGFIADFCCVERRLVIELDGGQHAGSAYDLRRAELLRSSGFRVVRFWNNDVMQNIEGVLNEIMRSLEETAAPSPQPSPTSSSGRGSKRGEPSPAPSGGRGGGAPSSQSSPMSSGGRGEAAQSSQASLTSNIGRGG